MKTRVQRFAFLILFVGLIAGTAQAQTHYVNPDGICGGNTPCYTTIQAAVTAAGTGDLINVAAATYAESNIHINSVGVTLQGAGPGSTVIDPGGSGVVLYPDADKQVIRDLTIQNGSQGIRFEMAGGTIDNTEINNVEFLNHSSRGIEIHNATTVTDLRVIDSVFDNVSTGIRSASSGVIDGLAISGSTFQNLSLGFYQANGGSTGFARNVHIDDCTFINHSDTPIFGEELSDVLIENSTFLNNARGFTIFKFYTTAGIDFENVTIRGNDFSGMTNTAIILYVLTSPASNVVIEDNTINTDIGLVTANWGQIDIRLSDAFANGPVTVQNNTVTLAGSFGAGATAVYAMKMRGRLANVSVIDNTLDGGGVGDAGGIPPTAGVYIQTDDGTFGALQPGDIVTITGNTIKDFVDGVNFYDAVGSVGGGLPAGAAVNVNFNDIVGNTGFGIDNGGTSETIDGTCNWWGDLNGPSGAGPGAGDAVSANATFYPWSLTPAPTACTPIAMVEKQQARDGLAALLPTGDSKNDKEIEKALKALDKSLDPDLWVDPNHLDEKDGHKVFNEEKKAVKHLLKVTAPPDVSAFIDALVLADETLAQIAIDEAIAGGGDPKELAKANEEMAKAADDLADGKPDKAIDHYKKAWEHALKALKKASKHGEEALEAPVVATEVPSAFSLEQNYPNPFNPATTIRYAVPEAAHVRVRVFNVLGQEVARLVDRIQEAGQYAVTFDASHLSSGTYLYVMEAGGYQSAKMMVLLK